MRRLLAAIILAIVFHCTVLASPTSQKIVAVDNTAITSQDPDIPVHSLRYSIEETMVEVRKRDAQSESVPQGLFTIKDALLYHLELEVEGLSNSETGAIYINGVIRSKGQSPSETSPRTVSLSQAVRGVSGLSPIVVSDQRSHAISEPGVYIWSYNLELRANDNRVLARKSNTKEFTIKKQDKTIVVEKAYSSPKDPAISEPFKLTLEFHMEDMAPEEEATVTATGAMVGSTTTINAQPDSIQRIAIGHQAQISLSWDSIPTPGNYSCHYKLSAPGCSDTEGTTTIIVHELTHKITVNSAEIRKKGTSSTAYPIEPLYVDDDLNCHLNFEVEGLSKTETTIVNVSGSIESAILADALILNNTKVTGLSIPAIGSCNLHIDPIKKPGTYTWRYTLILTSDEGRQLALQSGSKTFTIKEKPAAIAKELKLKSQSVAEDNGIQKLKVSYGIIGVSPAESLAIKESSILSGPISKSFGPDKRTLNGNYESILMDREVADLPSGDYDWNYTINADFGQLAGTVHFTVKPKPTPFIPKKIVLISAAVVPTSGTEGDQYKLAVKYRLEGLPTEGGISSSVDVTEENKITDGPESVPTSRQTRQITTSIGEATMEQLVRINTVGSYKWCYTITAHDYGQLVDCIPLTVNPKIHKKIALVSASVIPKQGLIGTKFSLHLQYQLEGLASTDTIVLTENDNVSGAKTETHQTCYPTATQETAVLTKDANFTASAAGNYVWNYYVEAPDFEKLNGNVPFSVNAPEQAVTPQLAAWLENPYLELVPSESSKTCGIYIKGWRDNISQPVQIVFPEQSDSWGSLPGQIVVDPGSTQLDPTQMDRGVANAHYCVMRFAARLTAPPSVVSTPILVRQGDSPAIRLVLSIKVLAKGSTPSPLGY